VESQTSKSKCGTKVSAANNDVVRSVSIGRFQAPASVSGPSIDLSIANLLPILRCDGDFLIIVFLTPYRRDQFEDEQTSMLEQLFIDPGDPHTRKRSDSIG
jgi:hypothetical protein